MSHLGCCALGVCCQGGESQATALSAEVPMEKSAADALAADGVILIPEAIENGALSTIAEHVDSADKRLAKLRNHARSELRAILMDKGHVVEAPKG